VAIVLVRHARSLSKPETHGRHFLRLSLRRWDDTRASGLVDGDAINRTFSLQSRLTIR
jgi:hypothetical protein